ncbi:holo-ACP synthase [Lacimicrobium alkaliphilum]|uniref:Holo-[acyl-carrier-protein] synthase n=1 Tax=Lacimicrobium alkaliphilum TaxID=1526571 RepID=A0ABQ1QYJ6_9ALTE|nr:holo-ACP synthase [Lacimicrobium alkaliphilum]GGD49994.1 holo-[acyl-carrier-protein] synthase [Lacimicrobium alkaliphilum]
MAIIGIGTDIVEIARIERQLQKSSRLAQRVLTDTELAEWSAHPFPNRFLAKRFAAKEATVKAFGTGIGHGVSFKQMEIRHYDSGQPYLYLSGYLRQLTEERSITGSHISIADEKHYAVATVVLEK